MMKTQCQNSNADEAINVVPYCSYEDFDKAVISSRVERLVKSQEKLGDQAISVDLLMKAAFVVGAHAKRYGNRTRFSIDELVLKMLDTSLDELLPSLIAMDAAGHISMKSTGNGTWAFCFLPPVINEPTRFQT